MGNKKKKDLDLSKTMDQSKTFLTEKNMNEPNNLGNELFNERADEIKDARDKMIRRIHDKSLDDSKSRKSKGRKKNNTRNSVIGLGSVISAGSGINDS